jgi:uncharacterized protein YxeA
MNIYIIIIILLFILIGAGFMYFEKYNANFGHHNYVTEKEYSEFDEDNFGGYKPKHYLR